MWFYYLRPVIQRIIFTFNFPHERSSLKFWQNMIHGRTQEKRSFSGWITVFCVFDENGHDKLIPSEDLGVVSSDGSTSKSSSGYSVFYSDGLLYPTISIDNIPPCLAAVPFPLKVNVDGSFLDLNVWLFAGHVGLTTAPASTVVASPEYAHLFSLCTLKPVIGWFVVFSPGAAVTGRPPSMHGVHTLQCHIPRPPAANMNINGMNHGMGTSLQLQGGGIRPKRGL